MIKHHVINILRKKSLSQCTVLDYSLSWKEIRVEIQVGKLVSEMIENLWKSIAYWIAPHGLSSLLPRTTSTGMESTPNPPILTTDQERVLQPCPQANLVETYFFSVEVAYSQTVYVCVQLTKYNQNGNIWFC